MNPQDDDVAPLPGTLCTRYTCCSKPTCRCRQGRPHGPYYYRVWREGSRVRTAYVKRSEVEAVRAACAAYKQAQTRLQDLRQERERLTRSIANSWSGAGQKAAGRTAKKLPWDIELCPACGYLWGKHAANCRTTRKKK